MRLMREIWLPHLESSPVLQYFCDTATQPWLMQPHDLSDFTLVCLSQSISHQVWIHFWKWSPHASFSQFPNSMYICFAPTNSVISQSCFLYNKYVTLKDLSLPHLSVFTVKSPDWWCKFIPNATTICSCKSSEKNFIFFSMSHSWLAAIFTP